MLWNTLGSPWMPGILGDTLEFSGILWGTLGYSGILWDTLGYSGILWNTLEYSEILRETWVYQQHMVFQGISGRIFYLLICGTNWLSRFGILFCDTLAERPRTPSIGMLFTHQSISSASPNVRFTFRPPNY